MRGHLQPVIAPAKNYNYAQESVIVLASTDTSGVAFNRANARSDGGPRRRIDANVERARSRLAHGTDTTPEYDADLLRMFAEGEQRAAVTIWAFAAIFSLASMFWAPWAEASLWLMMVIGTKVILLELCNRYLASDLNPANTSKWSKRFVLCELLCGITWASFVLIGLGRASPTFDSVAAHVFVFAALIVLLAVRMTFASPLRLVFLAGTVPMTVAVVVRLVSAGEPFYLALATMALGVHLYFLFLASGLRQTAIQMLEFRYQKDRLIAELDEETIMCREAREQAEESNRAKSRFLAAMSHELRTPLNAILGFSEVMKDELFGPHASDVYKEYSADIHASGAHLLHLINEILDLSRIEAGRFELQEERIHLADVMHDSLRLVSLKAEAKDLSLTADIDETLPQVWADARAWRQICLNLLSNAVKFTPKGGQIIASVKATHDGGQLIMISDTGPGIPKEEIPQVMEVFGQGTLSQETAEGGTGLGIPIVKNLVELHGGKFVLRSELRRGTEVEATLPKQRVLNTVKPITKKKPGKIVLQTAPVVNAAPAPAAQNQNVRQ